MIGTAELRISVNLHLPLTFWVIVCNFFYLLPPFSQPYLPVRYHPNKEDQIHSLQPRSSEIGSCHDSHNRPHPFPHRRVGFLTGYSVEKGVQILHIPLQIPSQHGQCSIVVATHW